MNPQNKPHFTAREIQCQIDKAKAVAAYNEVVANIVWWSTARDALVSAKKTPYSEEYYTACKDDYEAKNRLLTYAKGEMK